MAHQLSFPGFASAPKPTDRLFLAIFPTDIAASRMAHLAQRLRRAYGLIGTQLASARFHISLFALGDYEGLPQAVVAAANDVALSVAAPAFDVRLDRALSFRGGRGGRPLVLCGGEGVLKLMTFQQTLGASLARAGLRGRVRRRFTPHATLLYDSRGIPEQTVETISWTAREFVLVHSRLGGGKYVRLLRWPLMD